jgi:AcrR family transcriptional regulator
LDLVVKRAVTDGLEKSVDKSATTKRGRGRPRLSSTNDRILRATLELLRAGGPGEFTIEAVAAHCGIAKTTIYRRWPTRESLIVDALRVAVRARLDQVEEIQAFDEAHGSTVRGASRQILSLVNEPLFRSSFPMMARILLGDPALGDRFRAEVFAPLRALRRNALLELIATEEIRPEVDPDLVLDMINGAILYRALMAGRLDEEVADEIADLVTRAISPDATSTKRASR